MHTRVLDTPGLVGQEKFTDMSESRLTAPGKIRAWAYLSRAATSQANVTFSAASATIVTPEPEPSRSLSRRRPSPPSRRRRRRRRRRCPQADPHRDADRRRQADTHPHPDADRRHRADTPTQTPTVTPKPTPTPTPTPTPAPAPGGKPSAGTTGVPAGTQLRQHYGDITVTKDGTVLSGMDIHGFVIVRAANVKITDSIVRGGKAKGVSTGLITNYGYSNLLVEDVKVVAEYPSVYFDGIKGNNFTARRVHVVGNVDSIKIHGDNVKVENSLLENTVRLRQRSVPGRWAQPR